MRSKKGAPQESWNKRTTTSKYWTFNQQRPPPVFFGKIFWVGRNNGESYRIGPSGGHGSVITEPNSSFCLLDGNQKIRRFHAPVWGRLVVEIPLLSPKGGCLGFLKHQQYHRVKGLHQNLSTVHYPNLDSGVPGGRIWPRRALHVASLETEASTGGKGFNKWEDVYLMWFFRVMFVTISHLEAWRILWIPRMICVVYMLAMASI